MRFLKYIPFILFVLLGFFSENLKAEIIISENEKIESFPGQDFKEASAEKVWLGSLYPKEESTNQNQTSFLNFSSESLSQNFLGELCSRNASKNLESSFQIGGSLESHQRSCERNGEIFHGSPDLVNAWSAVNHLPDAIKLEPTVLSKLNDIASRGRGIDLPKLETALKGDLGDVLGKATGDDLTKILNRLDADHVTGSHLDEITSRLGNAEYGIKQDLLDNPGWFETFDDMLQNPGRYWERISQGELVNGSALQSWAQGKWWKDLRETAQTFQNTAGLNKVESIFGDIYGSQITLKVTKGNETFEIVADYLAKKDGVFYIVDTKYTTLDNFDLAKSFTPNQSKVFLWMKNGDDISIEIRAADNKLEGLNLFQGDMLDPNNLKIDIYKSVPGNSSQVAPVINYK